MFGNKTYLVLAKGEEKLDCRANSPLKKAGCGLAMTEAKDHGREYLLAERLRGTATVQMTTNDILALTRDN